MNRVERTATRHVPGRNGDAEPLTVTTPSSPVSCVTEIQLVRALGIYQQVRNAVRAAAEVGEFAGRHERVGAHDTQALAGMSALELTRTRAGLV